MIGWLGWVGRGRGVNGLMSKNCIRIFEFKPFHSKEREKCLFSVV